MINKEIEQEIEICDNCSEQKIIYLKFKTFSGTERYCEICWNLLRIDFEFN